MSAPASDSTRAQSPPGWAIACGALAAWLASLALLACWRDGRALVGAFDTGIYLQVIANFVRDGDLASSVTGERNFLAHHFQPVILLLCPLGYGALRPAALLALGLGATASAAALFLRAARRLPVAAWPVAAAAVVAFCAHPGVAGRVWFGFAPDVLALPAFAVMALALAAPRATGPWLVAGAALWAGACKEAFWLTDAAVLGAYFVGRGQPGRAALAAAAALAAFAALFLWWMPAHSALPAYYGLSYYLDVPPGGPPGLARTALALLDNAWSLRTAQTLLGLAALTLGLPFLRPTRCGLGALPGLALILTSRAAIVHHPANHYLLSVLPFLLGASLQNAARLGPWLARSGLARRWAPLLLAGVPVAYTTLMPRGLVDAALMIAHNPRTEFWRRDAERVRAQLPAGAPLVVDGLLQPLFADHRETTVLLGFTGNPRRLTAAELASPFVVVTTENLQALADCRQAVAAEGGEEVDYAYFVRFCERVRRDGRLVATYPDSGIVVFTLAAAAGPAGPGDGPPPL